MPTNLAIDDRLINQAKEVGQHRTKKEAVTAALEEYVKMQNRRKLIEQRGKIEFWPNYDHKKLRRRGRGK